MKLSRLGLGILLINLCGCGVTAKEYTKIENGIEKNILEASKGVNAKFKSGSEIKSDPWFKVPDFPFKYEQD